MARGTIAALSTTKGSKRKAPKDKEPTQWKDMECVDNTGQERKDSPRTEFEKRTLFVSQKEETSESLCYPESKESISEDRVTPGRTEPSDSCTEPVTNNSTAETSMAKGSIETFDDDNVSESEGTRLGYFGLGLHKQMEVPEADKLLEVVGQIEGRTAKILLDTGCSIFTDNQSAIQAVETPKRQSGQYIVEKILDTIDEIHKLAPTRTIHIEWVPGHKTIAGNEQADQAAKAAATPNATAPSTTMRSAQKQSIQSMAKIKWETEWKTGRQNAKRLRNMSQYPDTTTGPELYGELQQRKHVVCITRLRTGHCHLNEYLHRFDIIETAECECGAEKETIDHYLLNCELYDEERDALRRKVGVGGMRTGNLLGNKKIIKNTMEYIEKTGRFKLEQ
jgi:ribonuclease HI